MTKAEAIATFGSVRQLAAALKISPHAVYQWREERIPELRELQMARLAGPRIAQTEAQETQAAA